MKIPVKIIKQQALRKQPHALIMEKKTLRVYFVLTRDYDLEIAVKERSRLCNNSEAQSISKKWSECTDLGEDQQKEEFLSQKTVMSNQSFITSTRAPGNKASITDDAK